MKLPSTREVYWLEVNDSATMVMENTVPATVIIELATAVSSPRAPAAPAPNTSGHSLAKCSSTVASTATSPAASPTAADTMTAGRNQKLERVFCHQYRSLVITISPPRWGKRLRSPVGPGRRAERLGL